jgi:hypothetical protein
VVSRLRGDEPALELGDSGEGVQELQFRLYRLGYYRQFPDGTYDMATESAVRELQSSLGHDNTGEVTRESWEGIVYWEQQHGLDYEYHSPSDALAQLRYDLEHPQPAHDPNLSPDGHWRWDGSDWVAATATEHHPEPAHDPNLSPDGHWRWDGSDWVAAHEVAAAQPAADSYVGHVSPDGYWRWNGADW